MLLGMIQEKLVVAPSLPCFQNWLRFAVHTYKHDIVLRCKV